MTPENFVVGSSGEDKALETQKLCFRHMGIIRGLVSGLVSDLSVAGDLVQKVLDDVVSRGNECPKEDTLRFLAWVRDIAFEELRAYRKKYAVSVHPLTEEVIAALADTVARMDYAWQARRKALSECVTKLRGTEKEVMNLRYTQKMLPTRIVKESGLGMGAVNVGLAKARAQLLECANKTLRSDSISQKKHLLSLLEGHLEERLDTRQKVDLGEELLASEMARQIYWEYVFQHSALEELLSAEQVELPMDEFEEEEEETTQSQEEQAPTPTPVRKPEPSPKKKGSGTRSFHYKSEDATDATPFIIGALMAVTALAIVGWSLLSEKPTSPPVEVHVPTSLTLGTIAGDARIQRDRILVAALPGSPVYEGDIIKTWGETLVILNAGAKLTIWKDSVVLFSIEDLMVDVQLKSGAIVASANPEEGGARLTVTSPLARAHIIETTFLMASGPKYTMVDVQEGIVKITRLSDGKTTTVSGGQCSIVADESELKASERQDDETMTMLATDIITGKTEEPEPEPEEPVEPIEPTEPAKLLETDEPEEEEEEPEGEI